MTAAKTGEEIEGQKAHTDDCELVGAIAPLHLTQAEVQLFEWARRDRADAIKQLIEERKCNLNVQDNFNRTPLHFAASNGNLGTVKLLVQSQAIIDVVDKYGITPLMWAVYNNHKKVATYLIENGARYTRVTKQGHTIIHFIAESNAIGILKYLYQKFHVLKIDLEDHAGLTPFLVAAHRGNQILVEVFVKQRCFIKKKDKRQRDALHLAAWKGHLGVVSYLLRLEEIVQMINEVDSEGKSPLHLATESNHKEIIAMLLRAGADPNVTSENQDCPLIEASRNGFHACIDALLSRGADKNARTKDGNTALHAAAVANLPDTIYHLVGRDFDLHSTNERGQTPLHLAIEQNKLEAVEALILAGSWLDNKDKDGLTPLDVAARASYVALVDMIIKADRWRKFYPARSEAVRLHLISLSEELQYSTTMSEKQTLKSGQSQSTFDQASNTASSFWDRGLPGAYDDYEQDSDSDYEEDDAQTLTQPSHVSSHATTNRTSTTIQQLPAGFIDPYLMFPEPPGFEPLPRIEEDSIEMAPSVVASDDLSLGYEAATAWNRDSNSARTESIQSHQEYRQTQEHPVGSAYMENARSTGYSMEERRLSNGEVIVSIYSPEQVRQSRRDGGVESPLIENGNDEFTLLRYPQPCAEQMKVIFYKLSHKHLKPEDWKELAKHWEFKPEHVSAIEYQESDKNAYKEHGYRLMSIWLFNLDVQQSPVNEMYHSLIQINRRKLAKEFRKKVESGKDKHKGCRTH